MTQSEYVQLLEQGIADIVRCTCVGPKFGMTMMTMTFDADVVDVPAFFLKCNTGGTTI